MVQGTKDSKRCKGRRDEFSRVHSFHLAEVAKAQRKQAVNCGVITDWPAKIAGLVPVSPLMYLAARSAGGSDQLHAATGQLQTLPAC